MTLHLANVTFDCTDPLKVSAFWSAALDLPIDEGADASFVSIGLGNPTISPTWLFAAVPEPKTAKSRTHLDMHADNRATEVVRLLALGATQVSDHDEWGTQWTVLLDPEGHEFCVAQDH